MNPLLKKYFFIFTAFFLLISCQEDPEVYDLQETNNAKETLKIKNYLGNYENIHPKVLYFKDSWNGYRFWMAYTPYPKGKVDAENPCIAVSNDGINWSVPSGLSNPLAPKFKGGYNSDTHLVFNEEKNQLEVWWRAYFKESGDDVILRRCSADGVNWLPAETMLSEEPIRGKLSPAVWIEKGVYNMVYSDGVKLKRIILLSAENDPPVWSAPKELPIDRGDLRFWHHDLIRNDDGVYQIVVCACGPGEDNNSADLYYVEVAPDFGSATLPVRILSRSQNRKAFDHRSIYRSSLVKVYDLYYLYYSAIDDGWHRSMALSTGDSPLSLVGMGN